MYTANRLLSVKASPTLLFSSKVKEMKSKGIDIIDLTTGEPDFDTPDFIKESAINAIKDGHTKYTIVDGTTQLKKAVARKFKIDNNIDYKETDIMVTCGAKQAIFNAMAATINQDDEVIINAPYWVSYTDIVMLFGGNVKILQTDNFKIDTKKLLNEINEKTKWIFLNSPSNPAGICYNKDELTEIGKILEVAIAKYPQLRILVDDIYEYLCYDNFKFHTLVELFPNMMNNILTINGVSKSYAMTGWRIGFCATKDQSLLEAMRLIQSQSTSNPCSISQEAAKAALQAIGNKEMEFIKDWKLIYERRRNLGIDFFKHHSILCNKPEGAFYLFPSIKNFINKKYNNIIINNSHDFCIAMLENANVGTVNGSAFGVENYFRISFATSDELLKEGLNRIANFIKSLK
jgi:aspartate aminotransferase